MSELAKQLSERLGIDEETAAKVADYVSDNWEDIAHEVEARRTETNMDDRDVPTDAPEETLGRIDDDEGWVLRQSDSC